MPRDQYIEHPALKPTILASALKSALQEPPPRREESADDRSARETPRAA